MPYHAAGSREGDRTLCGPTRRCRRETKGMRLYCTVTTGNTSLVGYCQSSWPVYRHRTRLLPGPLSVIYTPSQAMSHVAHAKCRCDLLQLTTRACPLSGTQERCPNDRNEGAVQTVRGQRGYVRSVGSGTRKCIPTTLANRMADIRTLSGVLCAHLLACGAPRSVMSRFGSSSIGAMASLPYD